PKSRIISPMPMKTASVAKRPKSSGLSRRASTTAQMNRISNWARRPARAIAPPLAPLLSVSVGFMRRRSLQDPRHRFHGAQEAETFKSLRGLLLQPGFRRHVRHVLGDLAVEYLHLANIRV